jgi:hypothetical protein
VSFDGTASSDPDPGDTLTYAWDLDGDGQFDDSTSQSPTFTYQAGTYTARLRVTDSAGDFDTESVTISAGNTPPDATISSPTTTTAWKVGDVVSFAGSASDPEQGVLPASALTWSLILHHCFDETTCHTHPVQTFPGVASGSFVAPDHEYPAYLELQLTARDAGGLIGTASVRLDPQTVVLTFTTDPEGLQAVVGSTAGTTPFTRTVIVGSSNSVSAPSPQTLGGNAYVFSEWSDGGARAHTVVAPATATTYTATFTDAPPLPAGLVAGYAFEEGSGTTVADAAGRGHAGTVTGATWVGDGKYGGALSFDGVNDWVTVADANDLDLATTMTLAAWVRPAALANRWRTVIFKEGSPLAYALYAHDGGTAPAAELQVSGSLRTARGTAPVPLNAWSHVAATFDGAALRLYVDGVLVRTLAAAGSLPATTGVLRLGGNSIWNEWFQGLIDEVQVYDRALAEEEIEVVMATPLDAGPVVPPGAPTALTASGSVGSAHLEWTPPVGGTPVVRYNVHRSASPGVVPSQANRIAQTTTPTFDDAPLAPGTYYYVVTAEGTSGTPGSPSNEASAQVTADTTGPSVAITSPTDGSTVSGQVTVAASASDASGVAGVQFTLDGSPLGSEDTGAPYSITWDTLAASPGTHVLRAVARDGEGNVSTSSPVGVTVDNALPPQPSGLVAAYSFDEGDGGTVGDRTGKGHAGTITGATWSPAGKHGGALSFDGVNDWVTVADANDLDLVSGLTLEAWVRPTELGNRWRTVIFKEGSPLAYALYAHERRAGPIAEVLASGAVRSARRTTPLPLNVWSHLAATYDGTTLRLYVDGTLVAPVPVTGSLPATSGALRLGGNDVWNEWFQGLMDDVRIYDRALSEAEIRQDLATPVP